MESLKIIVICLLAAVAYGVLHDQVTARVCVEYFTVGHPPVFATRSPTLLALGWGVIATWWVGLLLGILAALAARFGAWPKVRASELARPIAWLCVVMAIGAFAAGILGAQLADWGTIRLPEPLASRIPAARHRLFLADAAAHLASYAVAFFGGLGICGWVVAVRRKRSTAGSRTAAA
jgi:hypothetical protein